MLNKIMLIGRLCADPETRFTPSGVQVTNFRLAADRKYKDSNGEYKKDTLFVRIVCWNKLAKKVSDYLSKGSLIYLEGRLQIQSVDKNGQKTWYTDIIANSVLFLEKREVAEVNHQSSTDQINEEFEFIPEELEEIP